MGLRSATVVSSLEQSSASCIGEAAGDPVAVMIACDAVVSIAAERAACAYGVAAGGAGGDDLLVAVASGLIVGAAGDAGGRPGVAA